MEKLTFITPQQTAEEIRLGRRAGMKYPKRVLLVFFLTGKLWSSKACSMGGSFNGTQRGPRIGMCSGPALTNFPELFTARWVAHREIHLLLDVELTISRALRLMSRGVR